MSKKKFRLKSEINNFPLNPNSLASQKMWCMFWWCIFYVYICVFFHPSMYCTLYSTVYSILRITQKVPLCLMWYIYSDLRWIQVFQLFYLLYGIYISTLSLLKFFLLWSLSLQNDGKICKIYLKKRLDATQKVSKNKNSSWSSFFPC